jgi:hypothetical protein
MSLSNGTVRCDVAALSDLFSVTASAAASEGPHQKRGVTWAATAGAGRGVHWGCLRSNTATPMRREVT